MIIVMWLYYKGVHYKEPKSLWYKRFGGGAYMQSSKLPTWYSMWKLQRDGVCGYQWEFPVYGKVLAVKNGIWGDRTGGPGDWPGTGEICCVPKQAGVSWELGGSKGVEWCRGRVTAKGSHSLVATVRSSPGRITSGSGVSITTSTDWDREVLGLSKIVIKVPALYWLVEVLVTEGNVMTWAAGNTDLLASLTRLELIKIYCRLTKFYCGVNYKSQRTCARCNPKNSIQSSEKK